MHQLVEPWTMESTKRGTLHSEPSAYRESEETIAPFRDAEEPALNKTKQTHHQLDTGTGLSFLEKQGEQIGRRVRQTASSTVTTGESTEVRTVTTSSSRITRRSPSRM